MAELSQNQLRLIMRHRRHMSESLLSMVTDGEISMQSLLSNVLYQLTKEPPIATGSVEEKLNQALGLLTCQRCGRQYVGKESDVCGVCWPTKELETPEVLQAQPGLMEEIFGRPLMPNRAWRPAPTNETPEQRLTRLEASLKRLQDELAAAGCVTAAKVLSEVELG